MEKLDAMIKEALEAGDRDIWAATEELGWFALGLKQFRGKLGWITWVIMVVQSVMFLAAVWCGVRFFGATDVLLAVKYGISGTVLALSGLSMKLSLMPQIQADRVIRELKRVELMLVARQQKV